MRALSILNMFLLMSGALALAGSFLIPKDRRGLRGAVITAALCCILATADGSPFICFAAGFCVFYYAASYVYRWISEKLALRQHPRAYEIQTLLLIVLIISCIASSVLLMLASVHP